MKKPKEISQEQYDNIFNAGKSVGELGCINMALNERKEEREKVLQEENNKRWRLNDRLCEHFGIEEGRKLDDDLVDEVIKKSKEEREKVKADLLKIADAGEYEDLRREVETYFKKS